MAEISHIAYRLFQQIPEHERKDLEQLRDSGRGICLSGKKRKASFVLNEVHFSDADEDIIGSLKRIRRTVTLDRKNKCIEALSKHEEFSRLARLPKTHTVSYPGLIVPGLKDVPLEALLKMDIMIIENQFDYPVFVKPNNGSLGAYACSVYNREALINALKAIFDNTEGQTAVVQEKIEIDREYRCVYFNERAYLLFDRMFKERGIINGQVNRTTDNSIAPKHIANQDAWKRADSAGRIITETFGIKYFAVDFATDTSGIDWFIETNSAPSLSYPYRGIGIDQITKMAADMLEYIKS